MRFCLTFAAVLLLLAACTPAPPQLAAVEYQEKAADLPGPTAIVFADVSVFDGSKMSYHQDVLVEGDIIATVADHGMLEPPVTFQQIEGAGLTLLPGLVDSHAHLFSAGEKSGMPPQPASIAQAFLFAGVTTILIAAGDITEVDAVKSARSAGLAMPNIYYAGPGLTAPGGHPVPLLNAMLPWPLDWWMVRSIPVASGPAEAREQVGAVIRNMQPDLFKIIFDDLPPGSPHLAESALRAAIETAAAAGVRAVVHASGSADALTATQAGAALLMHIPQKEVLNAAQLKGLRDSGIPIVTTVRLIAASHDLARSGASSLERQMIDSNMLDAWIAEPAWSLEGFSEEVDRDNARIALNTETNFRKLLAAGVPLLVGTDSGVHGVFPGASIHRELAKLVELGMAAPAALASATSKPAAFLDPSARFGRIERGYRADLLLVRGDPSLDIKALSDIEAVYSGGRRLLRQPLSPQTASD